MTKTPEELEAQGRRLALTLLEEEFTDTTAAVQLRAWGYPEEQIPALVSWARTEWNRRHGADTLDLEVTDG